MIYVAVAVAAIVLLVGLPLGMLVLSGKRHVRPPMSNATEWDVWPVLRHMTRIFFEDLGYFIKELWTGSPAPYPGDHHGHVRGRGADAPPAEGRDERDVAAGDKDRARH